MSGDKDDVYFFPMIHSPRSTNNNNNTKMAASSTTPKTAITTDTRWYNEGSNSNNNNIDELSPTSIAKSIIIERTRKNKRGGVVPTTPPAQTVHQNKRQEGGDDRDDWSTIARGENEYQREPSGVVVPDQQQGTSYQREPSGLRVSQVTRCREEAIQTDGNKYIHPQCCEQLDGNVVIPQTTSKEADLRRGGEAHMLSSPDNMISITKNSRLNKNNNDNKKSDASRVTGVTGWTDYTGATPQASNLKERRGDEKKKKKLGSSSSNYKHGEKKKKSNTNNTRCTPPLPPPPRQSSSSKQVLSSSSTTPHDSNDYVTADSNHSTSSRASSGRGIKKILTSVSSVTGWTKEDKQDDDQEEGGEREEEEDFDGIDPSRGSFDLVIQPKMKDGSIKDSTENKYTTTKEEEDKYTTTTQQKKNKTTNQRHGHKKKTSLTAQDAVSVASRHSAIHNTSSIHQHQHQHQHQSPPVLNNLTYWSFLSVKVALSVITYSKTKNSSSNSKGGGRGSSENIAQVAANAVLRGGKLYDYARRKKCMTSEDFMKELATKVSVSILEAGGDHSVATSVAIAIMNEELPPPSTDDDSLRRGTGSSNGSINTSTESAAASHCESKATNSYVGSSRATNSYVESKTTNSTSSSISVFSRFGRKKSAISGAAGDDSIIAAAARGAKQAGDRADSERLPMEEIKQRNSGLKERRGQTPPKSNNQSNSNNMDDIQSVTASMASTRRQLMAKEAEILSRHKALEEAARINLKKEDEIRMRMLALENATKTVKDKTIQVQREKQKRGELKAKEEEIRLKNQQLEEATKLNLQKELEIKERMAALDDATAALLERAKNVQNEIDNRVYNAAAPLGRVDENCEYGHGEFSVGTQGKESSEYDNSADNSGLMWSQQQQELQRRTQPQRVTSTTTTSLQEKKSNGFFQQISENFTSLIDYACDGSCAERSEKQLTTDQPDQMVLPAGPSEPAGYLQQQHPSMSGLTADDQRAWSQWFEQNNNVPQLEQALHQAVNQSNIQTNHMPHPNQAPRNHPGDLSITNSALNDALNQAMDHANAVKYQPSASRLTKSKPSLKKLKSKLSMSMKHMPSHMHSKRGATPKLGKLLRRTTTKKKQPSPSHQASSQSLTTTPIFEVPITTQKIGIALRQRQHVHSMLSEVIVESSTNDRISVGDVLHSINGKSIEGKSIQLIVQELSITPRPITLTLSRMGTAGIPNSIESC